MNDPRLTYCKLCDFYTDHVSTAHDGLAARGLLISNPRKKAPPLRPDPDIMDNAEGIKKDLEEAKEAARQELRKIEPDLTCICGSGAVCQECKLAENLRVEGALRYQHARIGAYKKAQAEICNLDREGLDVQAVGRILSDLREEVIKGYHNAVLGD